MTSHGATAAGRALSQPRVGHASESDRLQLGHTQSVGLHEPAHQSRLPLYTKRTPTGWHGAAPTPWSARAPVHNPGCIYGCSNDI